MTHLTASMQREAQALRAHGYPPPMIARLLGVTLALFLWWRRLGLVGLLLLAPGLAGAQPATSPIPMPVTCVRNKGECPRGNARMTFAELQAAVPPTGTDASGRPYSHRGFIAYVYDCVDNSCSAGGGSTLCALRGSDDGLTWQVVVCGGTGGGSGAPTSAQYWIGTANGALGSAKNLGALGVGLVLNSPAGTPLIYAGTTCGAGQAIRTLNTAGAQTACVATGGLAAEQDDASEATSFSILNAVSPIRVTAISGTQVDMSFAPGFLNGAVWGTGAANFAWSWSVPGADPLMSFSSSGIGITGGVGIVGGLTVDSFTCTGSPCPSTGGGGGGDSVSVAGTPATDVNLVDTGRIDFAISGTGPSTVTADIVTGSVTSAYIGTDAVGSNALAPSAIQSGDIEVADLPATATLSPATTVTGSIAFFSNTAGDVGEVSLATACSNADIPFDCCTANLTGPSCPTVSIASGALVAAGVSVVARNADNCTTWPEPFGLGTGGAQICTDNSTGVTGSSIIRHNWEADGTFAPTIIDASVSGVEFAKLDGLNTSDGNPPNDVAGVQAVHWDRLTGVPAGFVDGTDDGGGGGSATADWWAPFGLSGQSTFVGPDHDTCRAWQTASPYADADGIRSIGIEVVQEDIDAFCTLGAFNGTTRLFNGTVATVSGRQIITNVEGSIPTLPAAPIWFMLCCDSAVVDATFRAASSGPAYGKTFTMNATSAVMPSGATFGAAVPSNSWVINFEPPALTAQLEIVSGTTTSTTISTTSTTVTGFTALPDWGPSITATWTLDQASGSDRNVRGTCADNTTTGCRLDEDGADAPVAEFDNADCGSGTGNPIACCTGTGTGNCVLEGTGTAYFTDASAAEQLSCANNSCQVALGGGDGTTNSMTSTAFVSRTFGCKVFGINKDDDQQDIMGRRSGGQGFALFRHAGDNGMVGTGSHRGACDINNQSIGDVNGAMKEDRWASIACIYDTGNGMDDWLYINGQNFGAPTGTDLYNNADCSSAGTPAACCSGPSNGMCNLLDPRDYPQSSDEPFHIGWNQSGENQGGLLEDCFVHMGVVWTQDEVNRWSRCGMDGKLCMCDGTTPANFLSCSTNTDCRPAGSGNTTAICSGGKCQGWPLGRCAGGANSQQNCDGRDDAAQCPSSTCSLRLLDGVINCNAAAPS